MHMQEIFHVFNNPETWSDERILSSQFLFMFLISFSAFFV